MPSIYKLNQQEVPNEYDSASDPLNYVRYHLIKNIDELTSYFSNLATYPYELLRKYVYINSDREKFTLLEYALLTNAPYLADLIRLMPVAELAEEIKTFYQWSFLKTVIELSTPEKANLLFDSVLTPTFNIFQIGLEIEPLYISSLLTKLDQDTIDRHVNNIKLRMFGFQHVEDKNMLRIQTDCGIRIVDSIDQHNAIAEIYERLSDDMLHQIFVNREVQYSAYLNYLDSLPYSMHRILNLLIKGYLSTYIANGETNKFNLPPVLLNLMDEESINFYIQMIPNIKQQILEGDLFSSEEDSIIFNKFMLVFLAEDDENETELSDNFLSRLDYANKQLYLTTHPQIENLSPAAGIEPEIVRENHRFIHFYLRIIPNLLNSHMAQELIPVVIAYLESHILLTRLQFEKAKKLEQNFEADDDVFSTPHQAVIFANRYTTSVKSLKAIMNSNQESKEVPEDSKQSTAENPYSMWTRHKNRETQELVADVAKLQDQYLSHSIRKWEGQNEGSSETNQLAVQAREFGMELRTDLPQIQNGFFMAVFDQIQMQGLTVGLSSTNSLRLRVMEELRYKSSDIDVSNIKIDDETMIASLSSALGINIVVLRADGPTVIRHRLSMGRTIYLGHDGSRYQSLEVENLDLTNQLIESFYSSLNFHF